MAETGSVGLLTIVLPFILLIITLGLIIFSIITSIWAYRDSKRRGKSNEYALLILIITLFFPIIGLIVYIVIRNDN